MSRPIGCELENSQGTLRNVKILQEGRHLCVQEFLIDSFTLFAIGHSWLNLSLQASTDAFIVSDDSSFYQRSTNNPRQLVPKISFHCQNDELYVLA